MATVGLRAALQIPDLPDADAVDEPQRSADDHSADSSNDDGIGHMMRTAGEPENPDEHRFAGDERRVRHDHEGNPERALLSSPT